MGAILSMLGRIFIRSLIVLVATCTLFELAVSLSARFVDYPFHSPTYSLSQWRAGAFFVESSPSFGVWHRPSSEMTMRKACFDVTYRANSYGARDVERDRRSSKGRTVVLGDSFVEGYGVEAHERFTDLLERESGREYLNFGSSGVFSPTQYFLAYRDLAKGFDHDTVLVEVLPDNDFLEDDIEYGKKALGSSYRPYFVGTYPNYTLTYFQPRFRGEAGMRADSVRRFFREFTWTENIRYYLSKLSLGGLRPSGYSGYFDYTPEQLDRLRYVLTQIRREAGDRKLVIVTIPRLSDFLRARGEKSRLPEKMEEIATSLNARYVDLLAPMAKLNDPSSYFLPCDGHWNAFGHQVAAELLRGVVGEAVRE